MIRSKMAVAKLRNSCHGCLRAEENEQKNGPLPLDGSEPENSLAGMMVVDAYSRSTIRAEAPPPPLHTAAQPRRAFLRSSTVSRVTRMRAPEAPRG